MQRVRSPQNKDCMLPPLLPLSAMDQQCDRVGTWVNWWMSHGAQSRLDLWWPTFWICPLSNMLLLLLSRFSRVRLSVTPSTAAYQAPPSIGFSRQEYWSGWLLPSASNISKHYSKPVMCAQLLWPNLAQPYERNSALTSVRDSLPVATLLEWGQGHQVLK